MSKLEKRVASLLRDSSDYAFSDLKKVLLAFGYTEVRVQGSHHTFRDEKGHVQVVPKKGGKKVKKPYVKRAAKILKLEEWYEQQKKDS
ncbi:MAG: type II toxin-antitoxin system HicA family toxin [Cyanobacteria bacterium P01_C01_bin.69]